MNMMASARGITSVMVSRTSSLREQSRPETKDDQIHNDSGILLINKRSLSNDKMTSDSMVPVFVYQRGTSPRHEGNTSLSASSPHSSNHHSFKTIKPVETSPRMSEIRNDPEISAAVKVSSQRLKFKHRNQSSLQGGPLIPDHNLMKEPQRDNILFTPRPPLAKRFSSDQDIDANSDIDISQSIKNSRSFQILPPSSAPRPPISPTRGMTYTSRTNYSVTSNSTEKNDKIIDNGEEDTSGMEDIINSDCESTPPPNDSTEITKDTKHRSSLRKGSYSPIQSDGPGRGSPSPTKTVKWNLNAEVKKIPRSRSTNGKFKSPKSRSQKAGGDKPVKISINDQKLVESHEAYIGDCTTLMRHQMSSLEDLRHDRISISHYKKGLSDLLEHQIKLVDNLQHLILSEVVLGEESAVTKP